MVPVSDVRSMSPIGSIGLGDCDEWLCDVCGALVAPTAALGWPATQKVNLLRSRFVRPLMCVDRALVRCVPTR